MTQSRSEQVALDSTPFYHCTVRCVRRAFLCGDDTSTGSNYDHRKQWLVSRLRFLSYVYAIDICAYAVMSNHYHVVLHVDEARALSWTDNEVVERWLQLYNGHPMVDRWLKDRDALSPAELDKVAEFISLWRERLYSMSWFMRGVNETIARMANDEDGCKGRFWEGRFRSQALLDDAALLSCMAYVDLNPVRAGMEGDLVDSDFTSIQQRLFERAKTRKQRSETDNTVIQKVERQQAIKQTLKLDELPEAALMPFDGSSHTDLHQALPFTEEDYVDLVDTTGRVIRDDKGGSINQTLPPILQRLGINPDQWLDHVKNFGRRYAHCAGRRESLMNFASHHKKHWCKGVGMANQVYGSYAEESRA